MKHFVLQATAAIALLAGTLSFGQTSATVKDDLFNGTEKFAKGASNVTEMTMDPDSLQMVGGKNAARAHRTVLNVVRSYEYDKPGMYNIADVEEFRNKLNTGDWHCSVHTRDLKRGESTDICNKRRSDGLVETAIITVEPKELTFIHTVKQAGQEGPGGGMSSVLLPFGPESRAEMTIMAAQLKAQMEAWRIQSKAEMAALGPRIHIEMQHLDSLPMLLKSLPNQPNIYRYEFHRTEPQKQQPAPGATDKEPTGSSKLPE